MLINNPDINDLKAITGDYREILLSSMNLIADRYESDTCYHWIDTKLNLITGKDFLKDDPLRNKDIVYSWIQGRGLESLSLHIEWIRRNYLSKTDLVLAVRLESIISEVSESIRKAKETNAGHLFFSINSNGKALNWQNDGSWVVKTMSSTDPWNFSDIFISRGLFTESLISGKDELIKSAIEYINSIFLGVKEGNFVSDQLSLAIGNPVEAVKGRLSHAPWMILIGSMTLLLKHSVSEALESGIYAIRYILDNHVNINRKWPDLEDYDYVEFTNNTGELWYTDGNILSDPGHALEFVGLTIQFLSTAKSIKSLNTKRKQELDEIAALMFPVFQRNFTNGFNNKLGGIVKLTDLLTRKLLNREMPWWSLPETMRAALGCYGLVQCDSEKSFCMKAYSLCHNSLFKNYIRVNSPGMLAVQTRDGKGNIIDSIPAVPDADPGYHTGLALIDCLEMIGTIN